ncbi:MAG: PLP-dependent aminotransferase family protein [Actinomycetota bacterium]|nr:PLP-dependent aminotransferase family protein [Actinomycetota bacterium]
MTRPDEAADDWTAFGHDLLVSLADVPRGRWGNHLCEQVRGAIRTGALRPGVRLPSTRNLARDLGLSRGVAVNVYEQLVAEGYLESRPGSATRVAASAVADDETRAAPSAHRPVVNHNPGLPDLGLFPRAEWLRAYKAALDELTDADLRYGEPQGYEPLRIELADYLGRVRGITAGPDRIVIVNGYAQALSILARLLVSQGRPTIAVEEPGSTGARDQLRAWGAATPPVTVDRDGLVAGQLDATGADAVLVTPAHQYPTGVVLAPERRRRLLDWTTAADGYVIEDDYDAEFRYDSAPVGSLQPHASDRVISGSSVSKTLSPALRLGWLVLPADLVGPVVQTKLNTDISTATLPQAALTNLLRSGGLDRHLRRCRRHYRRVREQIVSRVAAHVGADAISGADAGLNLCIRFAASVDDRPIANGLRALGVACQPLSHYHQHPPERGGLVLDVPATTTSHLAHLEAALANISQ